MAKWWQLNILYPEAGAGNYNIGDVLQIYADDPTAAISGARAWLKLEPAVQIQIRDYSESPFTNQVITSGGVQNPPGSAATTTPTTSTPAAPAAPVAPSKPATNAPFTGPSTGIPENEPQAQYLRGLANRGVDTKTIAGRAQAGQASDFFRSFLFQNLLQGFTVPGQTFLTAPATEQGTAGKWASDPEEKAKQLAGLGFQEGDPNAFQRFAQSHDVGGARRGAADALRGLLTGNMSGVDLKALQTLRGPEQFGQPSEGQANQLAQLAQVALQSRISPLALDLLRLPSGKDVRDQFLAQGQGNSFLDYFRQQYPLMGLGI